MNPLISILILCYNAEQWLAETLESALEDVLKVKDGHAGYLIPLNPP
jgi:glycosyltransferase involved in cell wall biosynthesis